jgi:1-acyl-sn-glycerol-3-phosphate acyltransferase
MDQEVVADSAGSIELEHLLIKPLIVFSQLVIYPLLLIIRFFIVRNHLYRNLESLKQKIDGTTTNYVLYGNHQSKLDALIVCAVLPFSTIKQLLPFRFFVENSYFNNFILNGFLKTMGGFPANYTEGKSYGLGRARAIMATKQTIVIFPPGMRTREHIAKPGISMLATEPETQLIPIHLDWKNRWSCHVHLGDPVKAEHAPSPEVLMQHVYDLSKAAN